MSDLKGLGKVKLEFTVYAPCVKHKHWMWSGRVWHGLNYKIPVHLPMSTQFCGCAPNVTGRFVDDDDLQTTGYAQLFANNCLATAQTLYDTGHTSRVLTANSASSAITIVAGTGTTTPTVADYALTTAISGSSGSVTSPTIGSFTESGSSGTYTITGTFTNSSGGNLTYAEIGVTVTVSTYVFLILHDLTNGATGYVISNGGTGATTYTITNS